MIWLDVDTLLRQLSGGKKSLDDFAKAFFGVENGSFVTDTYTFDDIVRTLNTVQPHDWAAFLHQRLQSHGPGAPLEGLARGGYRLVYDQTQSEYLKSNEARRKITDLSFSIGVIIGKDGMATDVQWDGPAFKVGLTEGSQIVAVNGDTYTADDLKDAIRNAKGGTQPIDLLIKDNDQYRTVRIDYHDGLRYPHLERTGSGAASLDAILEPRK